MRANSLVAHVSPFFIFLSLLGLVPLLNEPGGPFWRAHPEFWVFPLQTVVCGALMIWWRRFYQFRPCTLAVLAIGAVAGSIAFAAWISPQWLFGSAPRFDGFNPTLLADAPGWRAATIAARLVRLVVVVPFLEEIFWRGFALRYLIREDFTNVPMGTFTWLSFGVVSVAFMLEHAVVDWPAALVTGVLFNVVAYRTRSLGACVATHAVANLLLGAYILRTGQWGFW